MKKRLLGLLVWAGVGVMGCFSVSGGALSAGYSASFVTDEAAGYGASGSDDISVDASMGLASVGDSYNGRAGDASAGDALVGDALVGVERARRHAIGRGAPAQVFFDGALLGNGAMGVVVRTRPDAVVLHFGHNNVWDIRVSERHRDEIGTFAEIFAKASAMPDSLPSIHHDPFFSEYLNVTADNYRSPYPRPFPCGSVILGFDRREVEVIGHSVDIATGQCTVGLLRGGEALRLLVDVDMNSDAVWLALVDGDGAPAASCFNRVKVLPDPSTPHEMPHYQLTECGDHALGFMQELPRNEDCSPSERDKAVALRLFSSATLMDGVRHTIYGDEVQLVDLERYMNTDDAAPFYMAVSLAEGMASEVEDAVRQPFAPAIADREAVLAANRRAWAEYWGASSVAFDDEELERMWYHNMYFFNCAVRADVTCPGIFANWSYSNIGTAWHGDYHLNYNTQQPFWLTFSSNHLDKNLAYVGLVESLMPISTAWARDYYGMRGAFFPHSAYPVEMTMHPYPVPDWGWEVFETPWMVQGLWWHYLYSGDVDYLRCRAFPPIKAAVEFLVDYMSRPEARSGQFADGKYHIFPTVPPELYGLQPGFKYNYDTQIDITLAKYMFKAYLEAVEILKISRIEKSTVADVRRILAALPEYPTADGGKYGRVLTSVPGERGDIVYNVPANLAVVFPGNEYGLHSSDSIKALVSNTIRAHQNEGGNDIVFLNLQKARMGMLDIEAFKRQVKYATLPGGTVTDATLQTGGRYDDLTDNMYMAPMGVWFENFALAAVVNECLMQSYDGVIRLFPNWDKGARASFSTLRAQGAFLVSATAGGGTVGEVEIYSERGGECRMYNPWEEAAKVKVVDVVTGKAKSVKVSAGLIAFPTRPQSSYRIVPDR